VEKWRHTFSLGSECPTAVTGARGKWSWSRCDVAGHLQGTIRVRYEVDKISGRTSRGSRGSAVRGRDSTSLRKGEGRSLRRWRRTNDCSWCTVGGRLNDCVAKDVGIGLRRALAR